jgi:molybdenum cofactor synthesis domain-containing protein
VATRTCWVITISDRAAADPALDRSGPAVAALLEEAGLHVLGRKVVPDETDQISEQLRALEGDLIVTTGGTGVAPRDVTPDATRAVIDYEVPGLGEEMRRAGREQTVNALLSRGLAGVRGRTLILNLPGSLNGATQSLAAVQPALGHALELLAGEKPH